jgi:uncharacterized protein (DUF305 family)
MKRMYVATLSFAAAIAAAQLGVPRAASADAMAPAAVDCSKASTMMSKPLPAMAAMPDAKMTLDEQFASAMSAHHGAMMAMARVEAACGKDAKARAMAKKMLDQMMKEQPDLDDLNRHSS